MKLKSIGLLIAIFLIQNGTNATAEEIKDKLQQLSVEGEKALAAKNWTLAERAYREILKSDPSSETARSQLALAYFEDAASLEASNPKLALEYYHYAVFNLPSEHKMASAGIDRILLKQGKDPASFQDRLDQGTQEYKKGDYQSCYVEYKKALSLKEDFSLRADFAILCVQLNRYDEALREATFTLDSAKSDEIAKTKAKTVISAWKASKGDLASLKELMGSSNEEPSFGVRLMDRKTKNFLDSKNKQDAEESQEAHQRLRVAWKSDQSNPSLCYLLGCSYKSQRKYHLAVKFLTKSLMLDPHFTPAKRVLKELTEKTQKIDER